MRVSPAKSSELHFAPPSLNLFQPYETLEMLEWVALLWILALAKARSAAPISAAISAQRATPASAKINATVDGARQKGSWRRRSVVTARYGDAPPSLLAIRPSASTRDPLQYFNSLLARHSRSPGVRRWPKSNRAIRVICGCPHFPRHSRPNLAQYISERLEMTPNGFGGKEGQNKRRKLSL